MSGPARIEGHRQVRTKIRRMSDDLNQQAAKGELKRMNLEVAEVVLSRAVQLVPVRSGTLQTTLRAAATQKSGRVRAGFARVPYAGPIHFGWARRNITPNTFLYDALDQRRAEVVTAFDRQLGELIQRYNLD